MRLGLEAQIALGLQRNVATSARNGLVFSDGCADRGSHADLFLALFLLAGVIPARCARRIRLAGGICCRNVVLVHLRRFCSRSRRIDLVRGGMTARGELELIFLLIVDRFSLWRIARCGPAATARSAGSSSCPAARYGRLFCALGAGCCHCEQGIGRFSRQLDRTRRTGIALKLGDRMVDGHRRGKRCPEGHIADRLAGRRGIDGIFVFGLDHQAAREIEPVAGCAQCANPRFRRIGGNGNGYQWGDVDAALSALGATNRGRGLFVFALGLDSQCLAFLQNRLVFDLGLCRIDRHIDGE